MKREESNPIRWEACDEWCRKAEHNGARYYIDSVTIARDVFATAPEGDSETFSFAHSSSPAYALWKYDKSGVYILSILSSLDWDENIEEANKHILSASSLRGDYIMRKTRRDWEISKKFLSKTM